MQIHPESPSNADNKFTTRNTEWTTPPAGAADGISIQPVPSSPERSEMKKNGDHSFSSFSNFSRRVYNALPSFFATEKKYAQQKERLETKYQETFRTLELTSSYNDLTNALAAMINGNEDSKDLYEALQKTKEKVSNDLDEILAAWTQEAGFSFAPDQLKSTQPAQEPGSISQRALSKLHQKSKSEQQELVFQIIQVLDFLK